MPKSKKKSNNDDTIFIGRKTVKEYMLAIMMAALKKDIKAIRLVARGKAIVTAVNVSQFAINRHGYKPGGTKLGTEKMPRYNRDPNSPTEKPEEARMQNVSTIEIYLLLPKGA